METTISTHIFPIQVSSDDGQVVLDKYFADHTISQGNFLSRVCPIERCRDVDEHNTYRYKPISLKTSSELMVAEILVGFSEIDLQ